MTFTLCKARIIYSALLSLNHAIELCSMTFTLCKARIIYSVLLLLNHAIAHLGEKALGSGGKSEDQPFSVKMPLYHDVWCQQAQLSFCGKISGWTVMCCSLSLWLSAAMRIRVLLYKFYGASCREITFPLFIEYSMILRYET